MRMFKLYLKVDDEQPTFYLQVNPQAPEYHFYHNQIALVAKDLGCRRIDEITPEKDTRNWWVNE